MRVQWAVMGTLELLLGPDCGLAQTKSSLFIKPTVIQVPNIVFPFLGLKLLAFLVSVPKLSSGARGAVSLTTIEV